MTPSQRARQGREEARDAKRRTAAAPAPPAPLLKHLKNAGGAYQTWPRHPYTKDQIQSSHFPSPLPHLPLFHTRYSEQSAERPHLVTVVYPSGQNMLRKITVLLNRRGVVSFEQLLLDISEALGFPRWHRARVTRLFTTHAQEIKGVCDFFRGEPAFLALGKSRPVLSNVQEALEELFPEHSHYQDAALQAWERKLRPAPDKTAKADSGYSEGMDSNNTPADPDNTKTLKRHTNAQQHHQMDARGENKSEAQKCQKMNSYRRPAQLPNHLQRLRARGGVRERQPLLIVPFRSDEIFREAEVVSPALCEKCLARSKQRPECINQLPGKTPLPPVSRKQKGSANAEQEVKKSYVPTGPPSSQLITREEKKSAAKSQAQGDERIRQEKNTSDVPSDHSDVTEEDIERCYDFGRVVGDGNFAVVRECRRRDNGQTLAVKIVERSKLAGREHMMQNELSLLGSLCHPRIVRLFAHRHTLTHSYLVMELVTGGDLFEAISERGTFSEAEAGLMVSDVGEALNYIHCKSIVHRDIKPENLLIECVAAGVSRLKLGDFGLAMVVTEPVFTICGTPTYVAPEILNETGYGVAVDVWALGVILYILLCGFPPFRSRDRNQEELFKLIKQGHLHFLSPFWDHISEEARCLVRALLQPEPTVRLTAGQTLLNPWVKAMAAVCQQGAPNDKAQRNKVNMKAEQDQAQRLHQNNASELTSEKSEFTKKEPIRPYGALDVHTTNCSLTCSSSREVNLQEIQDLAPELSNTHCSPENRMSLRNYFSGPVTQMDPLPQIKSQSQQNGQQCPTLHHTSASTNQRQTVSGHIVSTRPSSNPATASSSQSLHQQNSSCSLYNRNSSTSPNTSSQDCMEHVAHGANTQSPHCEPAP